MTVEPAPRLPDGLGAADAALLDQHRVALTGHCYRMLGSAAEADDAVQETLLRGWRNLDRFQARASLRTWLTRIATRVCLDALDERTRRARPMELGPMGHPDAALVTRPARDWIEPIPDAHAIPTDVSAEAQVTLRQSLRLAFVAALQHLPPRQRAVLLLTELLDWSAAEVADSLDTTVAAVNSALQRARATLAERDVSLAPAPLSPTQQQLADRYYEAFIRYDVPALTGLLRDDAVLSMPPYALWLRGPAAIAAWLEGRGSGCRGSRLIPTVACGGPAFGQYRPRDGGGHAPFALIVLEPGAGDRFASMTSFLDTAVVFPRFGLPLALPR